MRLARVLVLFGSVVVASCSEGPTITISNRSGKPLGNVVVSGSGFSESIGAMSPDEDRKIAVSPRGESAVRLTFDVNGQQIDSGDQGYFEGSGGYRVAVTVKPDLKVSVSSELNGY